MERPSISEIMTHEWYNGPVPTQDEVKELIEAKKEACLKENYQPDAQIPTGSPDPSTIGSATWRSSEGEGKYERKAALYTPEFKRFTQFFSTSEADTLFNVLALYADKKCKEIKFHK